MSDLTKRQSLDQTMADAPSTRKRTPHDSNDKHVSNWGLNLSVATPTEKRYKELQDIRWQSWFMKLRPIHQIKSCLVGRAPSEVRGGFTDDDGNMLYTNHGHVVYFYCNCIWSRRRSVHMYKSTIDTWYLLPDCPAQRVRSIIMIQGELTAIGDDHKLYTLTGQGAKQQWTEEYPPIPEHQNSDALAAICVGKAVIVFTGPCVLIMNTESKQWSTSCPNSLTTRIHRDRKRYHVEFYDSHIWIFDPYNSDGTKYHLDTLLSSCELPIFEQVPPAQVSPTRFEFSHLHLAISSNGTLIAERERYNLVPSRDICKSNSDNPTDKSWETVGLLTKEKDAAMVALPDNRFMTLSSDGDRVLFFTID